MKKYKKENFPVDQIRRYLEPGPIVLISSKYKKKTNIMACGWHMVMEFEPSRIGCFITAANESYEIIRKSKECVFNIPTFDMVNAVIGVGNAHWEDFDKFAKFKLTPQPASKVNAPLIEECYANFECKLVDASLLKKYGMFVFEVVKAHVATTPKYPQTLHYRGEGVFMVSGNNLSYKNKFKPENL